MGLDLVETVMRIEEEFEIIIPDHDAMLLTTTREVVDYLMRHPEVAEKWSRDYVADSVWQILEDECEIRREDFNEDSHFIKDMGID